MTQLSQAAREAQAFLNQYGGRPPWTFYTTDGHIVLTSSCDEKSADETVATAGYAGKLPGTYSPFDYYVKDGKPVAREEMAPSIDTSPGLVGGLLSAILKGVPAGATITINGKDYAADGTPVSMTFALLGAKVITVRKWPAKNWTVTI